VLKYNGTAAACLTGTPWRTFLVINQTKQLSKERESAE